MEEDKNLSTDDKEQLAYIERWKAQKQMKEQKKLERKCIRRLHLEFAKSYFATAVEELVLWVKSFAGKEKENDI